MQGTFSHCHLGEGRGRKCMFRPKTKICNLRLQHDVRTSGVPHTPQTLFSGLKIFSHLRTPSALRRDRSDCVSSSALCKNADAQAGTLERTALSQMEMRHIGKNTKANGKKRNGNTKLKNVKKKKKRKNKGRGGRKHKSGSRNQITAGGVCYRRNIGLVASTYFGRTQK